jgi:ParB family chromosome partitioning protein
MTDINIKKRGLGRGLDALFQDARREEDSFQKKEPAVQQAPVHHAAPEHKVKRADEMIAPAIETKSMGNAPRRLPVDRLKPGKFQPRHHFDDEAIANLAESISVHGVLQPLLVRPLPGGTGLYEIIAGERRWRAAQKAQVHDVPVIIQDLNDSDTLEIALIENLQREDLNALEEAEGYQRLMNEFRHTQDVLAHRLGKSRSHVTNTLRLLKLPASVKRYLQEGALSAGHARALIGCENAEKIAEVIVKRSLSVRQTEKLVKEAATGKAIKHTKPQPKGFVPRDVDVMALEEKMSSLLGLKVMIDGEGAEGTLHIEYKSLDQLDDLIERLSSLPVSRF